MPREGQDRKAKNRPRNFCMEASGRGVCGRSLIPEALALVQAVPALGGAGSRAKRAGDRSSGRSKRSRGFLSLWTPGPRKKAPREGAEKATSMGKVGTSPELEGMPDVLEAQRRHIPTHEEAEGPGAQDRAWHPLCPSAQARRDPTPRVWADAHHPIL